MEDHQEVAPTSASPRGVARVPTPVAVAVAGATLVVAIAAVVVVLRLSSGPIVVQLEAASVPPAQSFTASAATVDPVPLAGFSDGARVRAAALVASDEAADRQVAGTTAGLYGSTGTSLACDRERLATGLAGDARRAEAWARAAGVPVAQVAATVGRLTPVVLAVDTAVTNHSYREGSASPYQAVLQAGTPVLVDAFGRPRVQCSSGNPLGSPATASLGADARFRGQRWDGFRPRQVVAVEPTQRPVEHLTTVDVSSGRSTTTRTDGSVALDGFLVNDAAGVHVVDESGGRTTVLDRPVQEVFDDGAGGLLFNLARSPGPSGSVYPTNDAPGTADQAAIWSLPAGASEPTVLLGSDDPSRQWHVLLGAGTLGGRQVMAYTTLRAEPSGTDEDRAGTGALLLRDLESGETRTVEQDAFGWELATTGISINGDRLAYDNGYGWPNLVVRDAALNQVSNVCAPPSGQEADLDPDCPSVLGIDEAGRAVTVHTVDHETGDPLEPSLDVVDVGAGEVAASWSLTQVPGPGNGDSGVPYRLGVDVLGNRAIVSGTDDGRPAPMAADLVDLATGREQQLGATGVVRFLRAPLVRPAATAPATTTTAAPSTTAPPAPPLDPMNFDLPGEVCTTDPTSPTAPVPIRGGSGQSGDDPKVEGFVYSSVDEATVTRADVDGDGAEETVVAPMCNWGGTGYSTPVIALRSRPDGSVELVGPVLAEYGRSTRDVTSVTAEPGGVIVVSGSEWTEGDAMCCGSLTYTARWRLQGGTWVPA